MRTEWQVSDIKQRMYICSHYNQPMPSIKAASGIDACDIENSVEKYE